MDDGSGSYSGQSLFEHLYSKTLTGLLSDIDTSILKPNMTGEPFMQIVFLITVNRL